MNTTYKSVVDLSSASRPDWLAVARDLGPLLASDAALHEDDSFVAENYVELKRQRVLSAGVPLEFGGGGATHAELCAMLRELAHSCGSTALALSMHTHLVAGTVWRLRRGESVHPLLRRVADEQAVLVSTGASDWLDSSGTAEQVEGGFRVSGRKIFGSGSPVGDLLVTSAVYDDPQEGPTALHFPVPMQASGVSVQDTWHAMGMRGTGSHDVVLDGVFVPSQAISLRRPRGKWHPFFTMVSAVALPIVMSVYVGIAEAARDICVQHVQRKRQDADVWYLVGEMVTHLTAAQMALAEMIGICADYAFTPDVATANSCLIRKTIVADAVLACVEKALETVGGTGLYRQLGLERLLRDVHGAQFHPLQRKRQQRFSGRLALGLEPAGV